MSTSKTAVAVLSVSKGVADIEEDARRRFPGYRPEFADIAARSSAQGGTISELAQLLGVDRNTVNMWSFHYPEFGDVIRVVHPAAYERVLGTYIEHVLSRRTVEPRGRRRQIRGRK